MYHIVFAIMYHVCVVYHVQVIYYPCIRYVCYINLTQCVMFKSSMYHLRVIYVSPFWECSKQEIGTYSGTPVTVEIQHVES